MTHCPRVVPSVASWRFSGKSGAAERPRHHPPARVDGTYRNRGGQAAAARHAVCFWLSGRSVMGATHRRPASLSPLLRSNRKQAFLASSQTLPGIAVARSHARMNRVSAGSGLSLSHVSPAGLHEQTASASPGRLEPEALSSQISGARGSKAAPLLTVRLPASIAGH